MYKTGTVQWGEVETYNDMAKLQRILCAYLKVTEFNKEFVIGNKEQIKAFIKDLENILKMLENYDKSLIKTD